MNSRLGAALDERIAAAFVDAAKSGEVANLIGETEAAVVASGEAAERARTRALDPALSAADVAAARREMEDAAFTVERMREAVKKLGKRLREVKRQEDEARRRAAYETAVKERDVLAAELAEVYPAVSEQLADIASRIAANDSAVEQVNRSLPGGAQWVPSAEMVARGLRGFMAGTAYIPRITGEMRLPAFKYSQFEPYAWPRSR